MKLLNNRRNGTTLIELLIYAVLLLLLLSALYAAFYISQLYYDSARGSTEAQQEAIKGMAAITRAITDGTAVSVAVQGDPNPPALRVLSARLDENSPFDVDTEGNVMWQRWVCIYLDTDTNELVRKEAPEGQNGLPSANVETIMTTAPAVSSLVDSNTMEKRVLARGVSELRFEQPAANRVTVTITTETESRKFGRNAVTLTTDIPLRQ